MNNIKVLRMGKGLSCNELGDVIGVRGGTVSAWENGYRNPELGKAVRMADFFEVTLDYLLGRSSA